MSTKYCIYRKPWGDIEAWEYIDDLEEAMSYWYVRQAIEKYGVEDMMPIVMNKCGGYHTMHKDECIAIIESDSWPTLSTHFELFKGIVNKPNFNYGWIDPLGNTYSCQYMGHAALAEDLVAMQYKSEYAKSSLVRNRINAPDDFLLDSGWIKVLSGKPSSIFFDEHVTKEALNKLLEVKGEK